MLFNEVLEMIGQLNNVEVRYNNEPIVQIVKPDQNLEFEVNIYQDIAEICIYKNEQVQIEHDTTDKNELAQLLETFDNL
ncbi:MAG: hypothetical protein R3321_07840 [Nitrososphaeraceae archaeon]|nr:hypothetical protein [Nitrososphaeraceae archaeon]